MKSTIVLTLLCVMLASCGWDTHAGYLWLQRSLPPQSKIELIERTDPTTYLAILPNGTIITVANIASEYVRVQAFGAPRPLPAETIERSQFDSWLNKNKLQVDKP